ncbi:ferritin [Parvibaculum sp.]|uniref:ferritin family protein n=1 Tax=Parvibaculum sp. TaxID=2024848 RepID=UPI00261ED1BE|nr:ferritin [Parvibaculum sp.]
MSDGGFFSRIFGRQRAKATTPESPQEAPPEFPKPKGAPMSSEGLHEENLSAEALNLHRAIVSLMEELEAVDWYNQRAEACTDADLKKILEHNRDEEIEHAVMVLEWLRRNNKVFDKELRERLFKDGTIGKD